MTENWLFDQAPNVAAITTRQVLEEALPILHVDHYSDDHSWAFTCSTTDRAEDGRVIFLEEALGIDPSLAEVADLPPGWEATRDYIGGQWNRHESSDI